MEHELEQILQLLTIARSKARFNELSDVSNHLFSAQQALLKASSMRKQNGQVRKRGLVQVSPV